MRGSHPVSVPLLQKVRNRVGRSWIRKHHPKNGKADGMGASFLSCTVENGDIRLVIDFRELKKCITRPNFETATPFQAVRTIPPGMKFCTVIDALKGYYQVPLEDEPIDPTKIFYSFRGISVPSSSVRRRPCRWRLLRRVSGVFDDLPNCRRIVEDILIYSATYDRFIETVRRLRRASAHKVAIHTNKMVFAQTAVIFCGYVVDADGFRPDPELARAIREFLILLDPRLCWVPGNKITTRTFSPELLSTKQPLVILWEKDYPLIREKFLYWASAVTSWSESRPSVWKNKVCCIHRSGYGKAQKSINLRLSKRQVQFRQQFAFILVRKRTVSNRWRMNIIWNNNMNVMGPRVVISHSIRAVILRDLVQTH